MAELERCKNCEESFDDSFDYCPYCGQETADILTVGVLFSNTIKNYFAIDARFFKSFIPLMIKPGRLAKRFVNGKRLAYLHPAQFYLFISIVFFFIFSFTVRKADSALSKALQDNFSTEAPLDSSLAIMAPAEVEAIDSVITSNPGLSISSFRFQKDDLDSLIANGAPEAEKLRAIGKKEGAGIFVTKMFTQLLKLYEQKGNGILKTLFDTIPIAMFFMLPLFALLLKIFFWKRGTFAHHIVFSFYYFTFLFTTFSILILANTFLSTPIWMDVLVVFSVIIYLVLALRHFYESRWSGAIIKANLISFLYMMIVLPIAMFGVIFVSFLLY
jgi:hypothetical protein